MKYFLDTEFIERGPEFPITLISIGIVTEDGREFYAINSEFDPSVCNDWVRANVLPHLDLNDGWDRRASLDEIAVQIVQFCDSEFFGKLEFWGYYCDYDWVVFAQIFGTMMDLPKGWPMYCRDLKQLCDDLGNPKLPEQPSTEHNALADAQWNKQVYEFLQARKRERFAQGII